MAEVGKEPWLQVSLLYHDYWIILLFPSIKPNTKKGSGVIGLPKIKLKSMFILYYLFTLLCMEDSLSYCTQCRWQKKPNQTNHKARKTKSASLQFIKLINEIKSHESKGMTIPTNSENACAVGTMQSWDCRKMTAWSHFYLELVKQLYEIHWRALDFILSVNQRRVPTANNISSRNCF